VKTIAVTETVWERLKEVMRREHAESMNETVLKLMERAERVPASRFGIHKKLRLTYTEKEHEEITKDRH
jgi:predicted CopG family antitoxin